MILALLLVAAVTPHCVGDEPGQLVSPCVVTPEGEYESGSNTWGQTPNFGLYCWSGCYWSHASLFGPPVQTPLPHAYRVSFATYSLPCQTAPGGALLVPRGAGACTVMQIEYTGEPDPPPPDPPDCIDTVGVHITQQPCRYCSGAGLLPGSRCV